jgi:hypothetical protein
LTPTLRFRRWGAPPRPGRRSPAGASLRNREAGRPTPARVHHCDGGCGT